MLDLTTTGRKSGQPTHQSPHLRSLRRRRGAARHQLRPAESTPAWALNLEADPHATVRLPRRPAATSSPDLPPRTSHRGDAHSARRSTSATRSTSTVSPAATVRIFVLETASPDRGRRSSGAGARHDRGAPVDVRGSSRRASGRARGAIVGDHRLRADPPRGVVGAPLLLVHLLLHRGGGPARIDRGHADAVLDLLGPQRVGERAQPELGRGVRRPGRRWRSGRPRSSRTRPPRGPGVGRAGLAGQDRRGREVDVDLLAQSSSRQLGDTGASSTTPATCSSGVQGLRQICRASAPRGRPGPPGRRRSSPRPGSRATELGGARFTAREQHQVVARDRAGPARRPRRCPTPAPVRRWVRRGHRVKHDLAEHVAVGHRGEPVAGVAPSAGPGRSAAGCRWRRAG